MQIQQENQNKNNQTQQNDIVKDISEGSDELKKQIQQEIAQNYVKPIFQEKIDLEQVSMLENIQIPKNSIGTMYSINEGSCKIQYVYPLKFSVFPLILGIFLSLITAGIFFLVCHQHNKLFKYFFFSTCNIDEATYFLAHNIDQSETINNKQKNQFQDDQIIFMNRKLKYVYDNTLKKFKVLCIEFVQIPNKEILEIKALDNQEIEKRLNLYGECLMNIKSMGFLTFFYYFMTKSNMIMVYISIVVWILQEYYFFAINLVWAIGICLIFLFIVYHYSNKRIIKRAKLIVPITRINSDNQDMQIYSNNLVPGDIIYIESGQQLPCDLIVVQGDAFVNESNITGESDPVPKCTLVDNNDTFSYVGNSNSVIYEGTQIINSNNQQNSQNKALGVVIRTGFQTKKGQVVRQSLFINFKINNFMKSMIQFNFALTIIWVLVFCINLPFLYNDEQIPERSIWLKLGEGIVNYMAAALIPFTNLSLLMALIRLQRKKIQGVHPEVVYESGGTEVICFDKTGTLTENKVNAKGFWSLADKEYIKFQNDQNSQESNNIQDKSSKNSNKIDQENKQVEFNFKQSDEKIQKLFATCHSAQCYHNTQQIIGDVIDVQMFNYSNFEFNTNNVNKLQEYVFSVKNKNQTVLNVIKRFDFKPENASMSVIVQDTSNNKFYLFIKGSPEKLKALCNQQSIPNDYEQILSKFTVDGYRVLSLAYKEYDSLEDMDLKNRNNLEQELDFLGLLILENPLKSDTKEVFQRLIKSELPLKIISGDNNQTVSHTGKEVGLIKVDKQINQVDIDKVTQKIVIKSFMFNNFDTYQEQQFDLSADIQGSLNKFVQYMSTLMQDNETQFAITGQLLELLIYQNDYVSELFINRLILVTQIFSRCTPNMKQIIIKNIKKQNLQVAMCGDGANDCLAIQEATTGISFATADAALTSSFCTTKDSIECVEQILAEGRNVLSTNYEMTTYYISIAHMRTVMHIIQIYYYSRPNDLQVTLPAYYAGYIFFMFFGTFGLPLKTLANTRIHYLMTSARSIFGTIGRFLIVIFTLLIMHWQLIGHDIYDDDIELKDSEKLNDGGQVNTQQYYLYSIYIAFSLIWCYVAYPSKRQWFFNPIVLISVLITLFLTFYIIFAKEDSFEKLYLVELSNDQKVNIVIGGMIMVIVTFIWEKGFINNVFLINKSDIIKSLKSLKLKTEDFLIKN